MTQCSKPFTVAIVAGEMSGDLLGAGLIKALKRRYPTIRFAGIAGSEMKLEGCESWFDIDELSVMGIFEIVGKLPRIMTIRYLLYRKIIDLKPDIFIGIDAPAFNLTLEGKLRRAGITTVHYVSPSIWAWKQERIFKIKRNTSLVLTLLPFEKAIYDKYHIPCRYVGHKIADDIPLVSDKLAARIKLQIPLKCKCLSLLPGSRRNEVARLTPVFLDAVKELKKKIPDLYIIVPLANQKRHREFIEKKRCIAPDLSLHLLDGHAIEAMTASDSALLASGTATLECMLSKCPMVVAYKMNPFTYWLAKRFIKIPFVSLPNILSGQALVPELLQQECNPTNIVRYLLPLLQNDNDLLKANFLSLHKKIRYGADEQAAKAIIELLNG